MLPEAINYDNPPKILRCSQNDIGGKLITSIRS